MGKSEEEKTDDDYKDGAVTKNALQVITIIGEIEGHDNLPATSKATKYEHMLPKLAEIEMDKDIMCTFYYEYSWWGCQCRTGTGRDDCFNEKANSFTNHRRFT